MKLLQTSQSNDRVVFYAIPTGSVSHEIPVDKAIRDIKYCPQGDHVVLVGENELFFHSRNLESRLETMEMGAVINDVSWSPDGRFVAVACADANIYIWELTNCNQPWVTCLGHASEVEHVSFSKDARLLVSSGKDLTTRIWDPFSGQELVQTSAGGRHFSSSRNGIVFMDGDSMPYRRQVLGDDICKVLFASAAIGSCDHLHFDNEYGQLAVHSRDGTWRVWDPAIQKQLRLSGTVQAEQRAKFEPESEIGFSGFIPKNVEPEGDINLHLTKTTNAVESGDLALGNDLILQDPAVVEITTIDRYVIGHPVNCIDGRFVTSMPNTASCPKPDRPDWLSVKNAQLSESSDDKYLAVSDHDKGITTIYEKSSGKISIEISHPHSGAFPKFSPDAKWLAISQPGSVTVYEVASGLEMWSVESDEKTVAKSAFSHNGKWLAIALKSEVRVYDWNSQQLVKTLPALRGAQFANSYAAGSGDIGFSLNDRLLAVGTMKNTVQLWDLKLIDESLESLKLTE